MQQNLPQGMTMENVRWLFETEGVEGAASGEIERLFRKIGHPTKERSPHYDEDGTKTRGAKAGLR